MPSASSTRPAPAAVTSGAAAGRPEMLAQGRRSRLAAAVLLPDLAPDAFILSVGVVILDYAVLADVVELRGRLHRLHLAGPRGVRRARRLRHRAAGHPAGSTVGGAGRSAACWSPCSRCRSASRRLRVRGASFVIVSIALVLILLLVFQSWSSSPAAPTAWACPGRSRRLLRPEQHERFFYLYGALLGVALLVWWAIDRSRFGMGSRRSARTRTRRSRSASRPSPTSWSSSWSRRSSPRSAAASTPCGSAPRPDLPVLDPDRRLHGADGAARRRTQPVRSAARRGVVGYAAGVLQGAVRRHAVPPRRPGPAARAGRAVHARRGLPALGCAVTGSGRRRSIREVTAGELGDERRTRRRRAADAARRESASRRRETEVSQ